MMRPVRSKGYLKSALGTPWANAAAQTTDIERLHQPQAIEDLRVAETLWAEVDKLSTTRSEIYVGRYPDLSDRLI